MEVTTIKEKGGSVLFEKSVQMPSLERGENKATESILPPDLLDKVSKGNEGALQQLADRVNQFMQANRYSLKFLVDREAGGVIIKVLDDQGKVVRSIPPETFLDLALDSGEGIGLILNKILE